MRQPEGDQRDQLMSLLHATVNSSHGSVYKCVHYYAKRVVNERPMITMWSHRTTLDAHDRHMDEWTADLLTRQHESSVSDYYVERFGGELANWTVVLEE
jgi:hypothetical protein